MMENVTGDLENKDKKGGITLMERLSRGIGYRAYPQPLILRFVHLSIMGIKGNAHPSLSAKSRCAFVQSGSRTTSKGVLVDSAEGTKMTKLIKEKVERKRKGEMRLAPWKEGYFRR